MWGVPGKASIITFGAPFEMLLLPLAFMRGFVHLVKPSARALAVSGLRIEILSRNERGLLEGLNIGLHSDWSGNGGRAARGIPFGLEVEVEYGREPETVCRIWATRVDETDAWLRPERGACLSGDLETRDVENIVLLDLTLYWGSVTERRTERRMAIEIRRVASHTVVTGERRNKIQNTTFTCVETRYTIVVYGQGERLEIVQSREKAYKGFRR